MSSQQSKNVCVLTNADSFVGYALAYRLLQGIRNESEEHKLTGHKIRVLCRRRSGFGMSKLEEMGAEVCEVNYDDENRLREVLKGARYLTCIPEHSSNRLRDAKNLLHAAHHQGVDHVSMLSIVGVDRIQEKTDLSSSHEFKNLREYCEIEHHLKNSFKDHCIIRIAKPYQLLYYLAPQIEGNNIFPSLVKKDKKWVMVNINDVAEGIWRLYKKEFGSATTRQRVWNFVGSKPMKTEEMAKQIGEGLGQRDLKFEHWSSQDMKKQLERIKQDQRFKERPDETEFRREHDGYWSFPVNVYLNDNVIEIMMEYCELANRGELEMENSDLKKALGEEPMTLRKYFEKNSNQFKRFK